MTQPRLPAPSPGRFHGAGAGALQRQMNMLNLPTKPMPVCDGSNPIAKPSKESSLRKKAAKRKEVEDLKREIDGKSKPKRAPIGAKLRAMVLDRDGRRCVLCGKTAQDTHANGSPVTLEVDHIVPVAAGGTNCESNLRTCCNVCNVGRGARRDPVEMSNKESEVSK